MIINHWLLRITVILVVTLFIGDFALAKDAEDQGIKALKIVCNTDPELIIAGCVTDIQDAGISVSGRNHHTFFHLARIATFLVDNVIKGQPPEKISVRYYVTLPLFTNHQPLCVNKRYLIFAARDKDLNCWYLLNVLTEDVLFLPLQDAQVHQTEDANQRLENELISAMRMDEYAIPAMWLGIKLGYNDEIFLKQASKLTKSENISVAREAKRGQICLGIPSALESLLAAEEKDISYIASGLEELKIRKELYDPLTRLCEASSFYVRFYAYHAIGRAKDLALVPVLAKGLSEKNENIYDYSMRVIRDILSKNPKYVANIPETE